MPFTALNGVRFRFDTYGGGDPVLLIESAEAFNRTVLGFLESVKR
jgi:hypothetical protein